MGVDEGDLVGFGDTGIIVAVGDIEFVTSGVGGGGTTPLLFGGDVGIGNDDDDEGDEGGDVIGEIAGGSLFSSIISPPPPSVPPFPPEHLYRCILPSPQSTIYGILNEVDSLALNTPPLAIT